MVIPVERSLAELFLKNLVAEYMPGAPHFGFSVPTLEGLRRGMVGPVGRALFDSMEEASYWRRRAMAAEAELAWGGRRIPKPRSPADWRFRPLRWELGETVIRPRDQPAGKVVPNLRVWIHPDDPNEGAPYWDITYKRVIAVLLPVLPQIAGTGTYVHVFKDGDGVDTRFSITFEPP